MKCRQCGSNSQVSSRFFKWDDAELYYETCVEEDIVEINLCDLCFSIAYNFSIEANYLSIFARDKEEACNQIKNIIDEFWRGWREEMMSAEA